MFETVLSVFSAYWRKAALNPKQAFDVLDVQTVYSN